jgi:hypothetical protein
LPASQSSLDFQSCLLLSTVPVGIPLSFDDILNIINAASISQHFTANPDFLKFNGHIPTQPLSTLIQIHKLHIHQTYPKYPGLSQRIKIHT